MCRDLAETFLAAPVSWRDVVEVAIHVAAVRACEEALGERLRGPGRTREQVQAKLDAGVSALIMSDHMAITEDIGRQLRERMAHLRTANVLLIYDEHRYIRLAGMQDGRSVWRHLPRGLHLIFSDQQHRRDDRIAGLWLEQSDAVPSAYAARKRGAPFRLRGAAGVRRYVLQQNDQDDAA